MENDKLPEGLEIKNPVLQEIKKRVDQYEKNGNRTNDQLATFAIGLMAQKIIELDEALKRQIK